MDKRITNYHEFSKQELIQRIEEMEEVISLMESDKNETELLAFPWVGNLGHWYWMIQTNQVVFNDKKATTLGYTKEEIPENAGFEYFTSKLHPDDYERVMDNMRNHLDNLTEVYEVEYRIQSKNGNYLWYYDRGKVTKRDASGKPIVISGIVFDISKNKLMESELIEVNEQLQDLVITDGLTGAFNKRFMIEKINNKIIKTKETKAPFSLIMLDIDYFKSVNDNFGHSAGDVTLKRVAEIITEKMLEADSLFRYGGDEFVLLLPNTELANAVIFAENLRTTISSQPIGEIEKVTVSMGVSSYTDGDTFETALEKTDALLYHAKESGRNCVSS